MDNPLKRFTNTEKWNDPWFRALSPATKLLWLWLVDHCDNAGVIDPDSALAAFQIGSGIEEKHFIELGDRIKTLPNKKLWIPKFIRFQFGDLMASSQVHCSIIKLIKSHSLDYPIPSISDNNGTVKGGDTPKDKDKDKEKVKAKGLASLEEVRICCQKVGLPLSDAEWFWNKCEGNGWTNAGRTIKSWRHTIAAWKSAGYMPSQKQQQAAQPSGNAAIIHNQTALTRVEARIKQIRDSKPINGWPKGDPELKELQELKVERARLISALGYKA